MAKHKIVEKWAAGLESWSDRPMAVKAKLVETDKMFRLADDNDGVVFRAFVVCAGYKRMWAKEKGYDMQFLHNSEEEALRWFLMQHESEVDKAKDSLAAKQRLLDAIQDNIKQAKWRTVQ